MFFNLYFYNISFTFEICFFILLLILLLQRTGFSISTVLTNINVINLVHTTILLLFIFVEIYFICFIFKFYFFNVVKFLLINCHAYFYYLFPGKYFLLFKFFLFNSFFLFKKYFLWYNLYLLEITCKYTIIYNLQILTMMFKFFLFYHLQLLMVIYLKLNFFCWYHLQLLISISHKLFLQKYILFYTYFLSTSVLVTFLYKCTQLILIYSLMLSNSAIVIFLAKYIIINILFISHSLVFINKFIILYIIMISTNFIFFIKLIIIFLSPIYYFWNSISTLNIMTNVISILNYYSFIPLFQTTSFLKTLIISDLTSYNLFHYNMFTLYNKYLILIFIFLYYIIIYLYYLIPKLLNVTFINLKFNFLFRYEYPILIGFLLLGYTLVINSNNLFIVYLGFEIQTFIILILSGQLRLFLTVITTSLKYFFYSILSSLLFLLSLLYLYSFSGTLNFYELNYFLIYNWTYNISGSFVFFGLICLLFSFFFKLGVFPFYIWILDIFEGFPRLITLLLLTLNKFNLYIFLIKFLSIISSFNILVLNLLLHILTIVGLSSLLFGSILAISQTNIHRFFAATSITHMGFLLLGLKINLYLINYEKSNSFNILYSYFILYLLHTFIIFFILIFWSGLLNSYINQIYYNYRTNFFFNLNFNFIKDFIWFNLFSKKIIIIFLLLLFNLSGFPPFSFFYIKLNLIFLFLYNYAYFDAIGSLYFSIIITGSYIRLISLIYLENNYSNFNNKTFFKYIYQLILLNTNNHTKIKQIYTNVEYWLLIITFSLLFYNYTIYLF